MHLSIILLIISVVSFIYCGYQLVHLPRIEGVMWGIGMIFSGFLLIPSMIISLCGSAYTLTEPTAYTVETTSRYVLVYTPTYEFKFDKKIDFDLWTTGKPAVITHYYNAWGVELTGPSGKEFPTINVTEQ